MLIFFLFFFFLFSLSLSLVCYISNMYGAENDKNIALANCDAFRKQLPAPPAPPLLFFFLKFFLKNCKIYRYQKRRPPSNMPPSLIPQIQSKRCQIDKVSQQKSIGTKCGVLYFVLKKAQEMPNQTHLSNSVFSTR